MEKPVVSAFRQRNRQYEITSALLQVIESMIHHFLNGSFGIIERFNLSNLRGVKIRERVLRKRFNK